MSAFFNLFYTKTVHFSISIALNKYVNSLYENGINYNQDNNFMSNTANNNSPKSELEDFNQIKIKTNDLDECCNIYG